MAKSVRNDNALVQPVFAKMPTRDSHLYESMLDLSAWSIMRFLECFISQVCALLIDHRTGGGSFGQGNNGGRCERSIRL